MFSRRFVHLRACVVAVITTGAVASASAQCLTFSDFSDVSSLSVNFNAAIVETGDGTVLRLAPALGYQAGSVFVQTPVSAATFSTYFQFRITEPGGAIFDCNSATGADGIVFVVQTVSSTVGGGGGGIGYSGINPSIGIEFDTWCNGAFNDPSSNHIGVDINGNVNHGVGAPHTCDMQPDFDNGNIWHAWIDYDGATVEVRANQTGIRPELPLLARTVDLADVLGQDTAYVGFTAGTGAAWGHHDILYWTYDIYDPTPGCPDLDGDGMVGVSDLLEVLATWGPFTPGCGADIDSDGAVAISDLLAVLSAWGTCP